MIPVWVGIDVCKSWLDIHISPEPKAAHPEAKIIRLLNTGAGVEELIKQLPAPANVGRIKQQEEWK